MNRGDAKRCQWCDDGNATASVGGGASPSLDLCRVCALLYDDAVAWEEKDSNGELTSRDLLRRDLTYASIDARKALRRG